MKRSDWGSGSGSGFNGFDRLQLVDVLIFADLWFGDTNSPADV